MDNILIVKQGALGDVLRTTSILNVLEGHITWFTKANASPLLENIPKISCLTSDIGDIAGKRFDVVINLDDDLEGCRLLHYVTYDVLYGFYEMEGKVLPTEGAKEWWAMSLNGGKDRDLLKKKNKKSFQQLLFKAIGREFSGEDYVFGYSIRDIKENVIGLEASAGARWPMKVWPFYGELKERLLSAGFDVKVFSHKEDMTDYINEVNSCKVIVAGDTLSMHIGLALKKKVIAIFGPTSFNEIEMYGRGKKLYGSMDCLVCYKSSVCEKNPNCMQSVSVDKVYSSILGVLKA